MLTVLTCNNTVVTRSDGYRQSVWPDAYVACVGATWLVLIGQVFCRASANDERERWDLNSWREVRGMIESAREGE